MPPSPSEEKLTQIVLLRASQVEVTAGQCPCDTFLGQAFSLGLLATLGIIKYPWWWILESVCRAQPFPQAGSWECCCVRSSHTQPPFLSSWSVCEAGRVREKWAGLQCCKLHKTVQMHQNIFVWKTWLMLQHWAQIWSTETGDEISMLGYYTISMISH